MKHYKLVKFLSNLNVKPPFTNVYPPRTNEKPPIDFLATVLLQLFYFVESLKKIGQ